MGSAEVAIEAGSAEGSEAAEVVSEGGWSVNKDYNTGYNLYDR